MGACIDSVSIASLSVLNEHAINALSAVQPSGLSQEMLILSKPNRKYIIERQCGYVLGSSACLTIVPSFQSGGVMMK